LTELLKK